MVTPLTGIVLKILSALAFTLMSAGVKWLGNGFPTGQIVFFRSAFALLPLGLWLAWRGGLLNAVRTSNLRGHLLRGAISSCGMFAGFVALANLPLSDAIAIGYAAPLITVVLAALVLKETVRAYRWAAVGVGFAGVLVMLYPSLRLGADAAAAPPSALGAGAALLGACCAAMATVQVRRLTATERTGAIVLYFSLMTTALGLATILFGWTMPNGPELLLLAAIGILGGIGQILLTQSFRFADASLVAPFDYSTMIWALPIGWALFGHLPDRYVVLGSLIVAGAGLFVIWRERRGGRFRNGGADPGPGRPV